MRLYVFPPGLRQDGSVPLAGLHAKNAWKATWPGVGSRACSLEERQKGSSQGINAASFATSWHFAWMCIDLRAAARSRSAAQGCPGSPCLEGCICSPLLGSKALLPTLLLHRGAGSAWQHPALSWCRMLEDALVADARRRVVALPTEPLFCLRKGEAAVCLNDELKGILRGTDSAQCSSERMKSFHSRHVPREGNNYVTGSGNVATDQPGEE